MRFRDPRLERESIAQAICFTQALQKMKRPLFVLHLSALEASGVYLE
jgi:hypothetical protein